MVCRLLGSPTSANQWDAERKLGFNTCKSHLQLLVHVVPPVFAAKRTLLAFASELGGQVVDGQ